MNQAAFDFSAAKAKRRPKVSYWPTTPLSREQMAGAIRTADHQDEAVLAIFRAHTGCALSPSHVHRLGVEGGRHWLLTSVRRSISNLTNDTKVLECTGMLVDGPHGRPEHTWSLVLPRAAA